MLEYETTISQKELTRPSWWEEGKGTFDLKHVDEPTEAFLELTDADTMENFSAHVIICNDKNKLAAPNLLHIYDYESMAGRGKPMLTLFMQLVDKIEEPEIQINIRRDKQRFTQMKGEMLRSLLTQDKDKK